MLKSLSDFRALPETELAEAITAGPILLTQNNEPKFVAQSVEDFEAMVRRLRQLEMILKRRSGLYRV